MNTPQSPGRLAVVACIAALGALSGCAARPTASLPEDFEIIRSYGWDTSVADPEASWSPATNKVVARDAGGFVILLEGDTGTGRQRFASKERRETHHPVWINEQEVVFGPSANAERLPDGRVVPASEGLTVVTLNGATPLQKLLSKVGYRPRIGKDRIFAQVEDHIVTIDEFGGKEDFGPPGFFAEPQRDGDGVCWQETPVTEPDWWTGKPVRSNLVIRWSWRQVDQLPGGLEPRWTNSGGVVATVLRAEPASGQPWYEVGTDVVHIAGPKRAPVVVAHNARDASPHPTQPVIAVATPDGRIAIVSCDGTHRVDIAEGRHPQWSPDGTRLLVEEARSSAPPALPSLREEDRSRAAEAVARAPGNVDHQPKRLTVHVFKFNPGPRH
ncbi:MAG: hypothetical protein H0W83_01960 [Planctomycetes bacterium]|nr:hypothetical protein [Planctomycetota bacterium]